MMTKEEIISKLQNGWTLENHGPGWWLFGKRIPYKRTITISVPEKLVNELEKSGIIEITIPYRVGFATLRNEYK